MIDTKYENLCSLMTGASHALGMAVAQKPFDAASRQSFTREVAASHLVSPSRLQVAASHIF